MPRCSACQTALAKCALCTMPASHAEYFYEGVRFWCEHHTPWSGHHENCPDPCKKLLAQYPHVIQGS